MSLRTWSNAARFGGAGVVLGLALAWSLGGPRGLLAQAAPATKGAERPRPAPAAPVGEAGGTLALIAPWQPGTPNAKGQLLYLIDTKSRAFAVYRIDPEHDTGTIKLEGTRQYQWDLQLTEYNNQEPAVSAISAAVKAAGVRSR
jgi:hypothetical protein